MLSIDRSIPANSNCLKASHLFLVNESARREKASDPLAELLHLREDGVPSEQLAVEVDWRGASEDGLFVGIFFTKKAKKNDNENFERVLQPTSLPKRRNGEARETIRSRSVGSVAGPVGRKVEPGRNKKRRSMWVGEGRRGACQDARPRTRAKPKVLPFLDTSTIPRSDLEY